MAEKEKKTTAATPEPQTNAQEDTQAAKTESQTNDSGNAKPQVEAEKASTAGPKTVKIRLFKDNDKYKDDVFVAVNGRSYQIRRGEEVEVPDFVAEVLERSMNQDAATANLIESESSRFKQESEARNL